MEIYWQIQPARSANAAVGQITQTTGFINRMQWKFQGWLNGMNGGPLRQPTMKIPDRTMATLRRGLIESRLPCEQARTRVLRRSPPPVIQIGWTIASITRCVRPA